MSADLMRDAKISWTKVARVISERLGKKYSPGYVQEVASGARTNHTITQLCRVMGVPLGPPRMTAKSERQMFARVREEMAAREAAGTLRPAIDEEDLLYRQRRILATHLREALRESRALRTELDESQSRAAATALRLGNEITEKISKIEAEHERVKAERDAFEQERNALQARLFQSDKSRREMVGSIERLSKQVRSRRVTHIRLGNELFRNRTGA